MSKRKYTHLKTMELQIISMREAGMTRQEIADALTDSENPCGGFPHFLQKGAVKMFFIISSNPLSS